MIRTYRRVLGLPGALAFSMSALVGRLPISMVGLGLVVLISSKTGSYSLAGTVTASYVVASAVCALVQARLIDQFGQSRVLPVAMVISSAALVMAMVAVQDGWRTPWPHLFAAVCGGTLPMVGAAVRTRWSHLVKDKSLLQTAFAFEAVLDEVVFVVGPTLVTVLATMVHPLAGLTTALMACVVGTTVFCSLRSTEPPATGWRPRGDATEPMRWAIIAPLAAAAACMGMLFGAVEVATVAFAEELGHKAAAGPLLAVWALGSALAGLVVGALHWRSSNATRFRWALLGLAILLLPLPFVGSLPVMGVLLFLAGFAISPGLIAAVAWIEETVPTARLNEGMAAFSTGLLAGVAPGAATVGWVVDRHGASTSYWVAVAAGFVGAALAFATAAVRRREPVGATPVR